MLSDLNEHQASPSATNATQFLHETPQGPAPRPTASRNRNGRMEEERPTRTVQVQVPINIALIKYWGKKDEEQMLPLNDSISVTINALYAKTTIELGLFPDDEVTINGKPQKIGSRFQRVFE
ncbi:diphosphomevalonate decarboxylase, partial [Aphelenchoides avenae]